VTAFVHGCKRPDINSCDYLTSVVTDQDGRYSYTYTPNYSGYVGVTHVEYGANGGADPYVQIGSGVSRLFIVDQPAQFFNFRASRYANGLISVTGQFEFTNHGAPAHFDIKLQYSANGVDGWRTYATFTDQWWFEVNGVDMPKSVYWRAVYPGERGWQRTVSEVVNVPGR
jgi:hypothetical protein